MCVVLDLKTVERCVHIEVGLSDMFEAPEFERSCFFGWTFLFHPLKLSVMQPLSPQSLLQTWGFDDFRFSLLWAQTAF